jgi:diguanylate cyclase (GGDEF)-like protein
MKTESPAGPRSPTARRRFKLLLFPGLVLALGLGLTFGLWDGTRREAAQALEQELQLLADKIAYRIEDRLGDHVQVLGGVVGFFDASVLVTRLELHRYVAALHLEKRYPSIQGIGFSELIPAERKAAHTAAIRGEGFPEYEIRPSGERSFYAPVVYIEPFAGPNLRALGYDMAPEPVRWAAAARARDLGQAALSGKVMLPQEGVAGNQAGFLLFSPIYRPDAPRNTLAERRASLMGWAYSVLRMHDLMKDVLKTADLDALPGELQLEVHDSDLETADTRLFALEQSATSADLVPSQRVVRRLEVQGNQWYLAIASKPGFAARRLSEKATYIVIVGGTASLLLAVFVGLQTMSQMRIAALLGKTARANRQLAERERDLLWAQRIAHLGSWSYDPVNKQSTWSEGMFSIWGLDPHGGPPAALAHRALIHPKDRHGFDEAMKAAIQRAEPYCTEWRIRRPDGEKRTIATICTPHSDERGEVFRLSGTDQDITDHAQIQDALREQAIRDPLTGMLNRRYLNETLPRELARCQRTGESLVVAMLDLDHFKGFNDSYGHEAGDQVLRAVGELLRSTVRKADLACRYGGEELTLILPGSNLKDARARLDDIRKAIAQIRIRYREVELPAITVSVGLAAAARNESDAAALMSRADAALYRAKSQGRNRVVAV